MKKLLKILLVLFISNSVLSQSGTVIYSVQINVDLSDVPKDKVNFITQMVNNAKKQEFKLIFNKSQSCFKLNEKLDNIPEYESKMENIARAAFTSSSNVYTDKEKEIEINQENDGTLVENKYDNTKWEITTESKKIKNYTCYKAIKKIDFIDRYGQSKTKEVIAWFSPILPYSYGPKNFYGLPGFILVLTENRATYIATNIKLENKEIKIYFPKGKTTTKEVYNKKIKSQIGM